MNLEMLFKQSKIDGMWFYRIGKYTAFLFIGDSYECKPHGNKQLAINDYAEFKFTFGISDLNSGYLLTRYFDAKEYHEIGIDLSSYYIAFSPHRYGNVPRGLVEDTILKLERAAGVNCVAVTPVVEAVKVVGPVCPACKGQKIFKLGFYTRECPECCDVPYIGLI